jgi:hypothetical protein
MTDRWILFKHPVTGVQGFFVSVPGVDVKTAGALDHAFSTDVSIPRLVASGSVVANPLSGWAPNDTGLSPVAGAQATVTTIYYGSTITAPYVAALATASSWPVPTVDLASQLSYLNGLWHTYICERPKDQTADTAHTDPMYGSHGIRRSTRTAPSLQKGDTDYSFASARFVPRVYSDRVEFVTNCYNAVTIKYLILEPR